MGEAISWRTVQGFAFDVVRHGAFVGAKLYSENVFISRAGWQFVRRDSGVNCRTPRCDNVRPMGRRHGRDPIDEGVWRCNDTSGTGR
jgi:hypothetical protein